MKQEEIIRQAIQQSLLKGIKLTRGPTFDHTKNGPENIPIYSEIPTQVDPIGAVLLSLGIDRLEKGWMEIVCKHLDVTPEWIHNFHVGFNVAYQLYTFSPKRKKGKGKKKVSSPPKKEKVSEFGMQLAKEFFKISESIAPTWAEEPVCPSDLQNFVTELEEDLTKDKLAFAENNAICEADLTEPEESDSLIERNCNESSG